jgi:hypothetical protein
MSDDNSKDRKEEIDNEKRDKIIKYFINNIVASVKDIETEIKVARPVAVEHIKILKKAKIIQSLYPPITDDKIKHLDQRIQKKIKEKKQMKMDDQ